MAKPFGFNVIGHVSGNLGLGVSARNVIQALLDSDFPVAILDIDPGLDRGRHDLSFEQWAVSAPEGLPYAINLLIFPPPTLGKLVPRYSSFLADPERLNVALILWELPVIPRQWRPALEFFDTLVAPSAFIRHTLDVELTTTMTIGARHPLYLPADVAPDRDRFGLGSGDLVYATTFEPASDPTRKNVLAVVEAFRRGLSHSANARLVIRLNNATSVPKENSAVEALRNASSRDRRIRLVTEPLHYPDVLSLFASSDVFVSLHRSEGIGLGPMEAMALGKACIATAWSGNMDYMDHTNAALVPYTLVPVAGATGAYSDATLRGMPATWADPDIDEAAAWMTRLEKDEAFRRAMGTRAAAAIGRFQEDAIKVSFAAEIKSFWEHRCYTGRMPNRKERLEAAFLASVAAKPGRTRAMARLRRAASQALSRHLLWRFNEL